MILNPCVFLTAPHLQPSSNSNLGATGAPAVAPNSQQWIAAGGGGGSMIWLYIYIYVKGLVTYWGILQIWDPESIFLQPLITCKSLLASGNVIQKKHLPFIFSVLGIRVMIEPKLFKMNTFKWKRCIYIYTENISLSNSQFWGVRVMIEPKLFKMKTFKWKRHTEEHFPNFRIYIYIYLFTNKLV